MEFAKGGDQPIPTDWPRTPKWSWVTGSNKINRYIYINRIHGHKYYQNIYSINICIYKNITPFNGELFLATGCISLGRQAVEFTCFHASWASHLCSNTNPKLPGMEPPSLQIPIDFIQTLQDPIEGPTWAMKPRHARTCFTIPVCCIEPIAVLDPRPTNFYATQLCLARLNGSLAFDSHAEHLECWFKWFMIRDD